MLSLFSSVGRRNISEFNNLIHAHVLKRPAAAIFWGKIVQVEKWPTFNHAIALKTYNVFETGRDECFFLEYIILGVVRIIYAWSVVMGHWPLYENNCRMFWSKKVIVAPKESGCTSMLGCSWNTFWNNSFKNCVTASIWVKSIPIQYYYSYYSKLFLMINGAGSLIKKHRITFITYWCCEKTFSDNNDRN